MYPINPYALYPNTHSDVISKEGVVFPRSDSLKSSNLSTFDTKVQTIAFVSLVLAAYSYVSFNEPIVLFASIKKGLLAISSYIFFFFSFGIFK